MKTIRVFVCLFLLCLSAQRLAAQTMLKGEVQATTGEFIAFARIGIDNSAVSTLSNESGVFKLLIPEEYMNARLAVQVPGFRTTSFSIDSLASLNQTNLVLEEAVRQLEEVTINRKRYRPKKKTLGNRSLPPYARASYGSHWTLVTLIDVNELAQIKKMRMHIGESKKDSVTLRPVLYSFDSLSQSPQKELINANAFFKTSIKKGWLDYDLSDQYLYTAEKVFIGFEILSSSEDSGDISVSTSLGSKDKHVTWERPSFTSAWRRASNTYLIKVQVEY